MSDKVNEFEQGEDAPVADVKTFQQTYKPDANFSYRVNSADEILSDTKKLEALIQDHYMNQSLKLLCIA